MVTYKELLLEEIRPFVRHVHLSGIEPFNQSTLLRALDYRIFYIYDGEGYLMINGRKYPVNKGNLLFWQPGIEYLIYSEPSYNMVIIGINFDFTWDNKNLNNPIPPVKSKDFNESRIVECIRFSDLDAFNEPVFIKDFKAYENILLEMNQEYTVKKKYYLQRICGLFLSIIGIVARYVSVPSISMGEGCRHIDLILDYIHANYNRPISNSEIGEKHNFHPNYVNRLMVLHTGTSLHQYLINYRISVAVNLMRTTGRNISEIAYSVGYKDVSYFSRAFKSKMGVSPSSYKTYAMGRI